MRRLMMIFGSALAILMAGCTADVIERQQSASVPDSEAWMYDESLPVPVVLQAERPETKGTSYPINTLADMDNAMFGIFAIDRDAPEVEALFMNNVAQYRHTDGNGFIFGTNTGHIPNKYSLYYPLDSEANYTFTAYSCRSKIVEGEDKKKYVILPKYEVTEDKKRVLVDIPVAQYVDVLWGKAEADGNGFNAAYIRRGLGTPNLAFKHLTAGLSFSASLVDGVTWDKKKDSLIIAKMEFNVPTISKLCIHDCDHPEMVGEFVEDVDNGPATMMANDGGSPNLNIAFTSGEEQQIGKYVFIKPQTEPVECVLSIIHRKWLWDDEKQKYEWKGYKHSKYQFGLDPHKFDETLPNGFEAGKFYRFNLNLAYGSTLYISTISTRLPKDIAQ